MRWGMVINLSKCTRCHACVAACRVEHFLPLYITWPRLIAWEQELEKGLDVTTYPVRCNHCKDAPGVKVCPSKATSQRQDGIVWVDQNKCVGCRYCIYCIIACPYQNRTFLAKKRDPGYFPGFSRTGFERKGQKIYPHQVGTTEKCNFCLERLDFGQARALTFGDLEDATCEVSVLVKEKAGFQLHPEFGTDPSVYYTDPGIGNAISNKAPQNATTGSHIPGLSSVDEMARRIFSAITMEVRS